MTVTLEDVQNAILDLGDQLADIIERLDRLEVRRAPQQRTQPTNDVLRDAMYQRIVTFFTERDHDVWYTASDVCRALTGSSATAMYMRSRCLKLARLGVLDKQDAPALAFRLKEAMQ